MNILNLQANKKLILYVMKWYVDYTSKNESPCQNSFIWIWVLKQLIYRIQATKVIYFDHADLRTLVYGFMAFDDHVKFNRNKLLKIRISKLLFIFTLFYIKTLSSDLKYKMMNVLIMHRPNQKDLEYILNL